MARIVLVHGIAQQQRSADDLEHEWLPSLAGGARKAGHPALADRLWPIQPDGRLARMAFYGDLFLTPDQQGDTTEFTGIQREVADEIAVGWLTNALESSRARDLAQAGRQDDQRRQPANKAGI